MVRFSDIFFVWICNKRGGFLSPCFPLDLFYCYRKFASQNWPRKFVNYWRIIMGWRLKESLEIYSENQPSHVAHAAAARVATSAASNAGSSVREGWLCAAREFLHLVAFRVAAMVKSTSDLDEQWLVFLEMAAGDEGKEKYGF